MVSVKDRLATSSTTLWRGNAITARPVGHVSFMRQPSFIQPFSGFNDLVQIRCDFGWRYAATEDITCGDNRAVEVAVSIFAFDEDGAFERDAGEKAFRFGIGANTSYLSWYNTFGSSNRKNGDEG